MADMTPERADSGATERMLPLFPLHTVLLPGAHLPLHIFEPRYRQLTADLTGERFPEPLFGVVAIRTSLIREVESLDHVHPIGCGALLREAKRLSDGRFDIVTTGTRRFRLLDIETRAAPYLMAKVSWLDDTPMPPAKPDLAARLGDIARAAHHRYCASAWERDGWQSPAPDTDLRELAYLLAGDCLLPLDDRQALLEERHPLRRLRTVCRLLNREAGFLSKLHAVPVPFTDVDAPVAPNMN